MRRLQYGPRARSRLWRARRIQMDVCLLALVLVTPTTASAQRPAVITSVRHANTIKEVPSLDWVGLYDQLPPYARWWKETAACAGIPLPPARPDSVLFYFVNAVDFAPSPTDKPGKMVAGVTYAASEQIVLSVTRLRDEIIVKHEMLHQILFWWGETDWDNEMRNEFVKCSLGRPAETSS